MQNHDAGIRAQDEGAALAELAAHLECDACGRSLPESPFCQGLEFFCDPCALGIFGVEPVVRVEVPLIELRRTP